MTSCVVRTKSMHPFITDPYDRLVDDAVLWVAARMYRFIWGRGGRDRESVNRGAVTDVGAVD